MSYAPPSPDAPRASAKIRPGRGMYWLGALFLVAGVAAAAILGLIGLLRFSDTIDEFGRFRSTNAAEVTFEEDGHYTIYYESESKIDGETVNGPEDPPPGLEISVTNEDGDPVDTDPVDLDDESIDEYGAMELPLVESDYQGEAIREVRIDEPGRYRFEATADTDDEFVIAIGKGSLASLLSWVLGALAAFGLGLLLGLVTIIVTAVKRSRRKRELQRLQAQAAQAAAFTYGARPGYPGGAIPQPPTDSPPVAVPAPPPSPPARSDWAPPPESQEPPAAPPTTPVEPVAPAPPATSPLPTTPAEPRPPAAPPATPVPEPESTQPLPVPAAPAPKPPAPEPPAPEPPAPLPGRGPLPPPSPAPPPAWAPPPTPSGDEAGETGDERRPLPPPPPPS